MKPKEVNEPQKQKPRQEDIHVGAKIRHLLIVEELRQETKSGTRIFYRCKCDCGKECVRQRDSFLSGRVSSCGCQKHFINRTHGMAQTRTYRIYHAMMQRCYDKTQIGYPNYGGAGIFVCERWRASFENFLEDMGECPSPKHSIDRIDCKKGYYPDNCRWATPSQQARNTRKAVLIDYHGEKRPLAEVAEEVGMNYGTLYYRIFAYGWPIEQAITTPIDTSRHRKTKYQRKIWKKNQQ